MTHARLISLQRKRDRRHVFIKWFGMSGVFIINIGVIYSVLMGFNVMPTSLFLKLVCGSILFTGVGIVLIALFLPKKAH
jgi:hypothetical protein